MGQLAWRLRKSTRSRETGQVGSEGVEGRSEGLQIAGDLWVWGVQVDKGKGEGQAGWGV